MPVKTVTEVQRSRTGAKPRARESKPPALPQFLGHHLIVDMWDCTLDSLESVAGVEQALRDAVAACRATLLDLSVHTFSPTGVTGIAVIQESHISVHTWPEFGYAAVDIFTCGETDAHSAVAVLSGYFNPRRSDVTEFRRGVLKA
ncbi:MAG: adenosylmethionine decarboxylase [bacterium]